MFKTINTLAVAIVLSILVTTSANAVLVNTTVVLGGNTYRAVEDDVNNRTWLDLTETLGMSPMEATSTFGVYGYSWATASDLSSMLDEFFDDHGPDYPTFRPTDPETLYEQVDILDGQASAWFGLFGLTGGGVPDWHFKASDGWYDDERDDSRQAKLGFYTNSTAAVYLLDNSSLAGGDIEVRGNSVGVFMVTPVIPEPSSILVLLSSMLAVFRFRRIR